MKRLSIAAFMSIVLLGFTACASIPKVQWGSEKPDVFCRVINEPDPLLMGSWKCIFERRLEEGGYETNPAEYRLLKYGDNYALYFSRVSRGGKKRYAGWREWTINGTRITSDTGVSIYMEKGEVFLVWQDGKPTKMTR